MHFFFEDLFSQLKIYFYIYTKSDGVHEVHNSSASTRIHSRQISQFELNCFFENAVSVEYELIQIVRNSIRMVESIRMKSRKIKKKWLLLGNKYCILTVLINCSRISLKSTGFNDNSIIIEYLSIWKNTNNTHPLHLSKKEVAHLAVEIETENIPTLQKFCQIWHELTHIFVNIHNEYSGKFSWIFTQKYHNSNEYEFWFFLFEVNWIFEKSQKTQFKLNRFESIRINCLSGPILVTFRPKFFF